MKKVLFVISILILFVSVILGVKAHPGGTDGAGGHTDHSTGEYHYHHGYSAHKHYDMDGDGVVDCPYDFNDKTNHNSNSSSSNKDKTTQSNNNSKSSFNSEAGLTIGIMVLLIVFWIAPAFFKK